MGELEDAYDAIAAKYGIPEFTPVVYAVLTAQNISPHELDWLLSHKVDLDRLLAEWRDETDG